MRRKNIVKIITVIALSVAMIFSMSAHVVAADVGNNEIMPQWDNIASMYVDMVFYETDSGMEGEVVGTARKQSTASGIRGTVYLFRLVDDEWEYMNEWSGLENIWTLTVGGTFEAESGVTYKAEFWVTAFTDDSDESFDISHIDTCP